MTAAVESQALWGRGTAPLREHAVGDRVVPCWTTRCPHELPAAVTPRRDPYRCHRPRMGDIGEPVRHIELEPLPETVPIEEPTPAPVPSEPEKVPA